MAYEYIMNSFSSSSLDNWDLHDLEVFKAAADISMVMEPTKLSSPAFSPSDSDLGYLQDVLNMQWMRSPCKRRRLSQQAHDDHILSIDHVLQNYWDWDCTSKPTEDFAIDCSGNAKDMISTQPDHEHLNSSISSVSDEEIVLPEMIIKVPEESMSASGTSNSGSSYKELAKNNCTFPISRDPLSSSEGDQCRKRKKLSSGVVYPFAVVKPGGFEGDVTLNDINERILMPPTRPVRHPVGDFACHPCVSSPNEPGLSGKAVVAFNRIQTQGRGTITIIRTRG